jgi:hypothetical protein
LVKDPRKQLSKSVEKKHAPKNPSPPLPSKIENKKMRGQRKRISKRIDQNCCGLLSAVAAGGSGDLIA